MRARGLLEIGDQVGTNRRLAGSLADEVSEMTLVFEPIQKRQPPRIRNLVEFVVLLQRTLVKHVALAGGKCVLLEVIAGVELEDDEIRLELGRDAFKEGELIDRSVLRGPGIDHLDVPVRIEAAELRFDQNWISLVIAY